MVMTDKELRRRFVMAVDEVIPPAPALEARVREDLWLEQQPGRQTSVSGSVFHRGSGLRLAAVATLVLLALATAALLSVRVLEPIGPSYQPTPLASPSAYKFTPTATTRSASWPAGGPIPAELEGCWQSQQHPNDPAFELCLGRYSFDIGRGYSVGNVVVNGSQVDFFTNACGSNVGMPYDGYNYTITGSQLVLTSLSKLIPRGFGPVDSWSNCGWELDGSYSRVAST
jgi:hypothetical protein